MIANWPPTAERRTATWARRLFLVLHAPVLIAPVAYTLIYSKVVETTGDIALVVALGAAVGILQVRHSAAAVRDQRPPLWQWSLAALIALAYVPLPFYGLLWGIAQTTVIASGLMLLPRRSGITVTVLVALAATVLVLDTYWGRDPVHVVYEVLGGVLFDLIVGIAVYGAARLVRVLDELEAARGDLADLAVGRERLRVSRDLHDLLGQSLSAVSLKGDLAMRLLERSPTAACAEIEDLTTTARHALHGLRAVTRDEHAASFLDETHGAAALLRAAGIHTTVGLDLPALPAATEAVLAWGVREAVTNVLRHSQALTCTIRAGIAGRRVWLDIHNDGAGRTGASGPPGHGLAGLAERARVVSGSVVATRTPAGGFHLRIELPIGDAA